MDENFVYNAEWVRQSDDDPVLIGIFSSTDLARGGCETYLQDIRHESGSISWRLVATGKILLGFHANSTDSYQIVRVEIDGAVAP